MKKIILTILVIASLAICRSHCIKYDEGITGRTANIDQELTDRSVYAHRNEIVVDLVDGLDISAISDLEKKIGETLLAVSESAYEPHRLMIVRVHNPTPANIKHILDLLKHDKRVEVAEPNYGFSIPESMQPLDFPVISGLSHSTEAVPNDALFKFQWNMAMIHAPDAWEISRGDGVVVAVIDTGVTHSGNIVEDLVGATFVSPYNFVDKTENANDDHGHGTHVAGTIAQVTNNGIGCVGVAPKCKIMPLKVLTRQGWGTVANIAAAIMYAADKGARVINMSLGGPMPSEVMEKAVNYAHSKGVIVVCAAGNEGPGENTVGYPAGYKNAVAVSSVNSKGNLAWYSSWGDKVAIAAPGGDSRADDNNDGMKDGILQNTIVMSDPKNMARYEIFQGTSMACPHVAGVSALIISKGILNPDAVLRVLRDSAQKKDNPKKFGAGIVDAYASVRMAQAINIMKIAAALAGPGPLFPIPYEEVYK